MTGDKRKSIMRIIVSGMVILAVCMFICIFHVNDIKNSFRKYAEETCTKQLFVSSQVFEEELNEDMGTTKSAADSLIRKGVVPSEGEIFQVLLDFCNLNDFYQFTYISGNGMAYDSSGIKIPFRNAVEIEQLKSYGNESRIELKKAQNDNEISNLAYIAPVIIKNNVIGHIVALKDTNQIFDGRAYEYLRELGSCFMVDAEGNVYASTDNKRILKNKQNDFFTELKLYSNQSASSVADINRFSVNILKNDAGSLQFTTSVGETIMVAYQQIEGLSGVSFVNCYLEGTIEGVVMPIAFRTILMCISLIVAVITLVIIIWVSYKNASDTIEKMAYEDSITKGKNLNYFMKKATEIMAVNSETPYLIQRFDIAHFRYLNESYGHSRADEVLIGCVRLAEEHYYEKEVCVRMNADQFLMLTENDGRVEQRRDSFVQAVNEYARSIGIKYPIRFKFGIYQVRKHDNDINVMIDRANVARKSLNGDEKELKAYYSDELTLEMRKIDIIESEMQKAMENEEFKVFLQPKWDIIKDEVIGAEALVRWVRDGKIIAYPDEFIPIFEKNGFIEKLDFYMLEAVCKRMRKALNEGAKISKVSINQSRILLYNPQYVQNIVNILNRYRIPEGYLELELTETVFFDDREKMIEIMNQLKSYKIPLLMDDFGSGYSSLNLLKDIPFDILKIDREFFSEAITSVSSTWILKKVTEMAEGLQIRVICEGVETAEQVEKLKKIGVQYVQGYFYGRPMDIEEFIEKYKD